MCDIHMCIYVNHVHTSESQCMPPCVSQALGKAAGCIRDRNWKEQEKAARGVIRENLG